MTFKCGFMILCSCFHYLAECQGLVKIEIQQEMNDFKRLVSNNAGVKKSNCPPSIIPGLKLFKCLSSSLHSSYLKVHKCAHRGG